MVRSMEITFTAEDLMTPRALLDCATSTDLGAARDEALRKNYDVPPVVEHGHIVGVLRVKSGEVEPLTDQWLVSRDTPIPELIDLFVETQRPAFLVLYGQRIIGLVTPADLNKLPARVFVFNLIAELELELARLAQEWLGQDEDRLCEILGDERWRVILQNNHSLREGNVDVGPVQLLYIKDLIKVTLSIESLRAATGYLSKKELSEVVRLRIRTMHPARPLVSDVPEGLHKLSDRLRLVARLLETIRLTQVSVGDGS